MRSFSLSVIATIACAVFSAAAPILDGVSTNGVNTDTLTTIPTVLTTANNKLGPIRDELQGLVGGQNIDVSVVQSKLDAVKGILNEAVTEVQAIAANPPAGILAIGTQTLSIVQVANLSCTFITTTTTILSISASLVGTGNISIIQSVIVTIGGLLATVLRIVLPLVGGLLQILVPLLGGVIPVLSGLGLTQVLQVLNVSA